jgi:long-chain acyl-CoA synthetase
MIYGEGREFNIALIIPDFISLDKWAANKNLPKDHAKLLQKNETKKFLETEIVNQLKNTYGSYEIPRKFIFIPESFSLENGMLTQTMKLKRRVVFDKYKDDIEKLYAK